MAIHLYLSSFWGISTTCIYFKRIFVVIIVALAHFIDVKTGWAILGGELDEPRVFIISSMSDLQHITERPEVKHVVYRNISIHLCFAKYLAEDVYIHELNYLYT